MELAKELIAQANKCAKKPVPVCISLSSWQKRYISIKQYIILELKKKYGIKTKIGKEFVEQKRILPIFDDLDTMTINHQRACVRKINEFINSEFKPLNLVITSSEEYRNYDEIFLLSGAISLQKLDNRRIKDFLINSKNQELWNAIQHQDKILNFLRNPLRLKVCSSIYSNSSGTNFYKELATIVSSEDSLCNLTERYVKQRFNLNSTIFKPKLYKNPKREPSPEEAIKKLSWLAKQMEREKGFIFFIEDMQPSLLTQAQIKFYRILLAFICGLVGFFLGFLIFIIIILNGIDDKEREREFFLLENDTEECENEINSQSGSLFNNKILVYLLFAVCSTSYLIISENNILQIFFSCIGFCISFIFGFGVSNSKIIPLERFNIPWSRVKINRARQLFKDGYINGFSRHRKNFRDILPFSKTISFIRRRWKCLLILSPIIFPFGITFLYVLIVVLLLIQAWIFNSISIVYFIGSSIFLIIAILLIVLILYLCTNFFGVIAGFRRGIINSIKSEIEIKEYPNQGIKESIKNTSVLFLIFLFLTLTVKGNNNFYLLIFSLFISPMTDYGFGGLAVLQHLTLRIILCWNNSITWDYARFLKFCAQRSILQKVGGGYQFMHISFQKYLYGISSLECK